MAKYWVLLMFMFISFSAFASEPAGSSDRRPVPEVEARIFDSLDIQTPTAVSNTIEFLLCGQDPKHWLCGQKNEQREEVSEAIVSLARIHKIPPFLLVVKFYLESRFDIHKIGKIGEVGIPQVHGVAKRGCELASAHGQMECGAMYLELLVEACKSNTLQSALLVYMSGKCQPSDKVWAIADYRLGLYFRMVQRAEKLIASGLLPRMEPIPQEEDNVIVVEHESTQILVSSESSAISSLQAPSQKPKLDIRAIVEKARKKAMAGQ